MKLTEEKFNELFQNLRNYSQFSRMRRTFEMTYLGIFLIKFKNEKLLVLSDKILCNETHQIRGELFKYIYRFTKCLSKIIRLLNFVKYGPKFILVDKLDKFLEISTLSPCF